VDSLGLNAQKEQNKSLTFCPNSLYANVVEIDENVREEYWVKIRNKPKLKELRAYKCPGKYSK